MKAEKDTKAMAKREVEFMRKNKAPKDMLKHEVAEHKSMGMKCGGKVKGYKFGGGVARGTGAATKGKKFSGTY